MTNRSPFRYSNEPPVYPPGCEVLCPLPVIAPHERGIDISHETIRFWWLKFGPMFASEIKKRQIEDLKSSHWRWHLDEVFVHINGKHHYLRRAVDHKGEVLES